MIGVSMSVMPWLTPPTRSPVLRVAGVCGGRGTFLPSNLDTLPLVGVGHSHKHLLWLVSGFGEGDLSFRAHTEAGGIEALWPVGALPAGDTHVVGPGPSKPGTSGSAAAGPAVGTPGAASHAVFSACLSVRVSPQVKMSLPATFAQHASSPSRARGSCCSTRRTRTASASTWSPGRPAARSRRASPSRRRSGPRPWPSRRS